jgi:hypothetical protein
MARADFKFIVIGEVFNSQNTSTTKNFTIESGAGAPIDTGYLLVQCRDVSSSNHKLSINGVELGSADLRPHAGWSTQMDRIPTGFLKNGTNTITIERIGSDDFEVSVIVVHWRENG